MRPITDDLLKSFRDYASSDSRLTVLQSACAQTSLKDLAFIPLNAAKLQGPFTIELKTRGITAQRHSGRCWCFAVLNILREIVAEKLNMPEFKFSANYLTFFDKLEKANTYLEMVIANADKDLEDRMMEYILSGVWDGGYFDMAVDLVKKYGMVPDFVMPETFQSDNTDELWKILNSLLKKNASVLRKAMKEGKDVTKMKDQMMAEIYKALCILFGTPVEKFDFSYRDKSDEYHVDFDLTPKMFFEKYVGTDLDEYITVTNEPTDRVPLHTTYEFQYTGSMAESKVFCLNLPLDEMKDLVVKQLKDNEPIWFACDSGHYGDRQKGIWDPNSFDYESLLGGIDLSMSKEDRLQYHETRGTHAMIFVGVNFDKSGQIDRWKIENSWGKEVGKDGYFVCSDRYFDEYVVEAIINKKHLTEDQKKILNEESIKLNPWQAY